MKKSIFLILTLLAVALTAAQAQTIKVGDRFYDGFALFTVQEIRMGNIVYMTDALGDRELTLEKWPDTPGKYTLRPSRNADDAPYGTDFGTHIDYVSQPDNKYLVVYGDNDTVARILHLVQPGEELTAGGLWYGGALVYTAKPSEDGSVKMDAMAEGQEMEVVLTPAAADGDWYEVSDGPEEFVNAFEGAVYARRIRREGLDVICFYDKKNRITDVLQATQNWDAQALNVEQWMAMIGGDYTSEGGSPVKFRGEQAMYKGNAIPMQVVTFNGMITGVLDFGTDGPFLSGKVEADAAAGIVLDAAAFGRAYKNGSVTLMSCEVASPGALQTLSENVSFAGAGGRRLGRVDVAAGGTALVYTALPSGTRMIFR